MNKGLFRDWRTGYQHTSSSALFKVRNFIKRIKLCLHGQFEDSDFICFSFPSEGNLP